MSKTKIVKKTVVDSSMSEMFESMIGGEGDPEITTDKFKKIISALKTISTTLMQFSEGPFSTQFPNYVSWTDSCRGFSIKIKNDILDAEEKLEYKDIKDHQQIRRVILMCTDLMDYEKSLTPSYATEPNSPSGGLNDKWITKMPGNSFKPFTFTDLDLKLLWNDHRFNEKVKITILTIISILFSKAKAIYHIVRSPDINVSKFSVAIVSSIEQIQTMPELHRCKDAFARITNSVSMLENNFGNYYQDMISAKNPNLIIENFILDVSKENKMDPKIMMQFRTIISFYKKQSANKKQDPKVQKLFDTLSEKMSSYDRTKDLSSPVEQTRSQSAPVTNSTS